MAQLVDANDVMFTPFEPKLKNRYLMAIDGIPAYLIKTANRPQITFEEVQLDHLNVRRWVKGKGVWQQLQVTLYDPVVPSAAQAVMEWVRLSHESVTGRDGYSDFYKKDVTFQVLGPVGDVVEEWKLKGTWCQDIQFGDLDFASSDPVDITMTLRYDYAILQF
tara:strand:- start:3634 stop:4122 length:489 start_codon:yes stop_codon:yes gene_type:complete